jgi:hypothetical protein
MTTGIRIVRYMLALLAWLCASQTSWAQTTAIPDYLSLLSRPDDIEGTRI